MRSLPLLVACLLCTAAAPAPPTGSAQAATTTRGPWPHTRVEVDSAAGPLSMHALVGGDPAAERVVLRMFAERAGNAAAAEAAGPLSVPTLVPWDAHDDYLFARNAGRSCARGQERCEVHVFDGAGHFVPWDDPAGLVAAWRAFVGR